MHFLIVFLALLPFATGFLPSTRPLILHSPGTELQQSSSVDDKDVQWGLLKQYHAKGSWKGIWTTFGYMGDVLDETVASVDYTVADEAISQEHTIVVGAKRADCATCFDSMETKSIPVAAYTPDNFLKSRYAANCMVNGPSLLRSGVMATELALSHGDGRVRVVFQHAPVWPRDVEPGSCPPQGLKIARVMVSREALRDAPPTAETEASNPPSEGNPTFYRPVPPFDWHKKWAGTSWTWGPKAGNRGWSIEELEEIDQWHGNAPVEVWNLRLPGGVFIQGPRIVTDAEVGLCRLAWMPDKETLVRAEAGILALQPMIVDDDTLVGFEPPSLASLRCDVLKKEGDLDGEPVFLRDEREKRTIDADSSLFVTQTPKNTSSDVDKEKKMPKATLNGDTSKPTKNDDSPPDSAKAMRDSLQL